MACGKQQLLRLLTDSNPDPVLAGLEEPGDNGMTEIVEAQAG